ncbi:MAG: DNA primase [Pseudomonadaceae bacterium]|nr:DNA primase [Pseudomonadaceae bacterium]
MKYPTSLISQIKTRIPLVEEVRKTVPSLKKKGKYWWANCPFHNEKSASFHVREEGNYYCFGCGAAGDVFTFVQETQGGSFNEVVEKLAKQAGLPLPKPEYSDPQAEKKRADGMAALERAVLYYQRSLPNSAAADYLHKRGLTPATVVEFQLGYAPEGWTNLHDALVNEGFAPATLREAGLTQEGKQSRGDYDRFRHRVMFPIHDGQGRAVGFGGRVLDGTEPKYLNSPENPYFNKGYLLYNLHRAKPHLKQGQQLVVVEGYMDVVSLYQSGFPTAVAPLGTAITEDQIALLWRYHPSPVICLDGDKAGQAAALRAAEKVLPILEPGKTLQFVTLPEGEDPDTLVQKDGIGGFKSLLAEPKPLEQVLWEFLLGKGDISTADGRAQVEGEMGGLLARIRNAVVRKSYQQALKDKLFKATRANKQHGGQAAPQQRLRPSDKKAPADYRPAVQGHASAARLLAIVCRWPELLPQIDENLARLTFPPGPANELAQHVFRAYTVQRLSAEELREDLKSGPHATTVAALLRSTGVATLDESLTSPQAEFDKTYAEWFHASQQRQHLRETLREGDWTAEKWEQLKAMPTWKKYGHDDNSGAEPDLTSGRDQPM